MRLHIVGRVVSDTWCRKAGACTRLALGRLVGIPVDSALIGGGRQGHRTGTAAGSRGHGRRGRDGGFCHRHRGGGGTAILGTRHGVRTASGDFQGGIGTVVRPYKAGIGQGGGRCQRGRSTRTDSRRSDRRIVDIDTHDRGRVDIQMMGGRGRTAMAVGTRHGIVALGGRGDGGVATHIVTPAVRVGSGGRQGDGLVGTGRRRTGDGHRGRVVGRHRHRGGVGTALRRSTRHRVSASGAHINGGGRCIVRPHIGRCSTSCQGRGSTGAHGSVTSDGNCRKGINCHRHRSRVGTSVGSGTCHRIGGLGSRENTYRSACLGSAPAIGRGT